MLNPTRSSAFLIGGVFVGCLAVFVVGFSAYQTWQQAKAVKVLQSEWVGAKTAPGGAAVLGADQTNPTTGTTFANSNSAGSTALGSATTSQPNLQSDIDDLKQQISSLSGRVAVLEKKAGVKSTPVSSGSSVKEVVIYLGTGSTANRDWTDISSAVASVNLSNYSRIKSVYFEAALSIVGGEAHARLMNQTTGSPLFETEVFNNTSSSVWETAPLASWPMTTTQFEVQLRSSSGEMASLDGSRIHILLQ